MLGQQAKRLVPASVVLWQPGSRPVRGRLEEIDHPLPCRQRRRLRVEQRVARDVEAGLQQDVLDEALVTAVLTDGRQPAQQRHHPRSVHLAAEPVRRGVFQVMRLVHHQVFVGRQQVASGFRVREQQRVVHDDQVGTLGLGSRPMDEAITVAAVKPDAVEPVRGDPRPEHLLWALEAKLGAVARLGPVQPDQDLQLEAELGGVPTRLGQVAAPAAQRDIVGAALEKAGAEFPG